ncbi:MAG: putative molybdenum carrier protein [Phycisphaerae bacterium]|nr:putative molybdenum carrier protein [Phycisphaerae bacterium]
MQCPDYLGIRRIISGGQTGADRAALDVAIELGVPHGGYVPKGRRAEDGLIPAGYDLTEMSEESYDARTEANVQAADATLIVSEGLLTGGSALTLCLARKHDKPVLHLDRSACSPEQAVETIRNWLMGRRPAVLNVAGPRESTAPGIYANVRNLLLAVFDPDVGRV